MFKLKVLWYIILYLQKNNYNKNTIVIEISIEIKNKRKTKYFFIINMKYIDFEMIKYIYLPSFLTSS